MSEFEPGRTVLVINLERDPVPAAIVRKMSWPCECGGVSWLCLIEGHGPYTVCASSICKTN